MTESDTGTNVCHSRQKKKVGTKGTETGSDVKESKTPQCREQTVDINQDNVIIKYGGT